MDEVYKITSTARTQLLERQLAGRLSELKSQMEEQGILQGAARPVYSSVQIPKDISYYRRERELALKRALQVSEPKPLVIQSDVLQRELESCLRREYTPENLPLLLLQYYTERASQLAQSKRVHGLRWRRLCGHSQTMERFLPLYKERVSYILQELSDAVQRAERLSAARENFLMGKSNPPNLVTQEDLTIYTKWLVCHLHSLRTIHHYLQTLQYLPFSKGLSLADNQVPEFGQEGEVCVNSSSPHPMEASVWGKKGRTLSASVLPQHTTEAGELNPQLRRLLSCFHVPFDLQELRDSAKEMELFSLVFPKFQSIFMEQQRMQMFPDYEAGITKAENLGLSGPAMALKKTADWIPFIKIKPKCDPWQKKMLAKLKERKRMDTLLQFQAKFLKISDPKRVVQVLQNHAARTATLASHQSSGMTFHQCNYDQVWENIYSNPNLYQSDNDLAQISIHQSADGPRKQETETGSFAGVHSIQFMESSEVESQDDHYSTEGGCVHTQDQHGVYVIYDVALQDLKELEAELLLRSCGKAKGHRGLATFAVSYQTYLNLPPPQLLDSYFEAYQHTLDTEERFTLAQVMTDIMHRRPKFDLSHPYFVKAYQDECTCLRLHLQLVRAILNHQLEQQREYVQRLWREDCSDNHKTFGLPLNVICNQLISINNSCPTLKTVHPLELHPSLSLVRLVPQALEHLLCEVRRAHKPTSPSGLALLELRVLRLALDLWLTPNQPEAWYSAQLQKDLFSSKVMGDPFLVEEIGLLALKSATDEGQKRSQDSRPPFLETFSKLLELLTLRHRLIEMSVASAGLAGLYKELAKEMGFEEFHLFLRPVPFELALPKNKIDQPPPVFMTSLLEDSGQVDRYSPAHLVLAISEVDENQVGKFSFYTKEAILELLLHSGAENMQVTLACQAVQKNALMVAIQQASFYHTPRVGRPAAGKETSSDLRNHAGMNPTRRRHSRMVNGAESLLLAPTPKVPAALTHPSERFQTAKRTPQAFVSIQLEKVGLRDAMLNAFLLRRQAMAEQMKSPDGIGKVKRDVIVEYCQKLNRHMSHYAFRGQIMAYYNSLRALLEDFPTIRDTFFMVGQPEEKKEWEDSKEVPKANPRRFQPRPRSLLSADGRVFLNLWFIPHPSEVLVMFKTLPEKAALRSLKLTLRLIAPLHDIVSYLFSFAKLGNCPSCFEFPLSPSPVRSDWGGSEGIGSVLQELQERLDSLPRPQDPTEVAQALLLHRDVMFLQFDVVMRHLLGRTFLAAGNVPAYQSLMHGTYHGLPPLSNSLQKSLFASQLSLPQPLDPRSLQALVLFPWRTFLEDGGPFPVTSSVPDTLAYDMQLCLCGLSDRDCAVAHGELVALQLLMEGVLLSSCDVIVEGPGQQATLDNSTQPNWSKLPGFRSKLESHLKASRLLEGQCDAAVSFALLRSFLVLWKQLEVLKQYWGQLKLGGQDISSGPLHRQFSELYEAEIFYPSMKSLARQMGKEDEFEGLIISSQSTLPPKGASEIEIKTQQLQKLLENLEIHMIKEVLRNVNREMALVLSEKSKEECTLPTDLWKHRGMKENFSVVRPQIVEKFIQRLMESCQDGGPEVTFRKDHLEACLHSLGCDVMARERSNFETYSMCYEHVLQHARQKLHQKEQEAEMLRKHQVPPEDHAGQVAELSHDMLMEITALRARLTDLEEENLSLKKQIRKEVQEEYEALVQALFMTCLHIKEQLDEHQLHLIQKVCELIGEVRAEGIASIKKLKKTRGSARPAEGGNKTPEQLWALEQDNSSRLASLVCKVRSLGRWQLAMQQARFQGQLSRAEKESIQSQKECLGIKLMAEQEVSLLRQQLLAVRQVLARAQADNTRLRKQQETQAQLLRELEHRVTQESVTRQQLDVIKTSRMEKLLEDVEQKGQQLQLLTEEAERASKLGQLQRKKLGRELRQMRSRLAQERSVKLDAFQRVEELQSQLNYTEPPSVQMSSPGGLLFQAYCSLGSASTSSRYSHQQFLKTNLMGNKMTRRIQRPRTGPPEHKERTSDAFLPSVAENTHLMVTQIQTAPSTISFKPDC
uniref:Coiled-coil domain containing 162 n=1 Tax=Jaculus jaculus TaxID=51337 RepID=A0A8C5KU15_JACJA